MKLCILLLLSPVALAQLLPSNKNPNDGPFMPIHPFYPYNPKLMKRGIEKDVISPQQVLGPELYAPKVDARDSYTASYSSLNNNNPAPPRDSYYPVNYNNNNNNNNVQKLQPAAQSPAYTSSAQYYTATPPYTFSQQASPTAGFYAAPAAYTPSLPYASLPYPNYYYQPQSYYPNYYTQPAFTPPPLTQQIQLPASYKILSSSSKEQQDDHHQDDRRQPSIKNLLGQRLKIADNEVSTINDSPDNQYVDGTNYVITTPKDLDTQPSQYRISSQYNQIDGGGGAVAVPMIVPKTTYRLITSQGQPIGEYTLPSSYQKSTFEQIMTQALAKLLLGQTSVTNSPVAAHQRPAIVGHHYNNRLTEAKPITHHQEFTLVAPAKEQHQQSYASIPNLLTKAGVVYLLNPSALNNKGRVATTEHQSSNSAKTKSASAAAKQPEAATRYAAHKPVTRVTLEESRGIYIPPAKVSKGQGIRDALDYEPVDDQSSEQLVDDEPPEELEPKRNSYRYQLGNSSSANYYSNYSTSQLSDGERQRARNQQYKTSLDDVNYSGRNSTDN